MRTRHADTTAFPRTVPVSRITLSISVLVVRQYLYSSASPEQSKNAKEFVKSPTIDVALIEVHAINRHCGVAVRGGEKGAFSLYWPYCIVAVVWYFSMVERDTP